MSKSRSKAKCACQAWNDKYAVVMGVLPAVEGKCGFCSSGRGVDTFKHFHHLLHNNGSIILVSTSPQIVYSQCTPILSSENAVIELSLSIDFVKWMFISPFTTFLAALFMLSYTALQALQQMIQPVTKFKWFSLFWNVLVPPNSFLHHLYHCVSSTVFHF